MRREGLRGVRRGKRFVTTRPDAKATRPPDLVQRHFTADAPNRLWVVDFTYVPTWEHMAFTAFVHDVCSHRIVGWRTAASMPTELPLDALEMAIWMRHRNGESVRGVIHHSDAGSQYTAIRYTLRLDDVGAVASIGSVGDSYDNAMAESLIGLYKTECVQHDGPFRTVDELELATSDWVHWYNHNRLHCHHRLRDPDRVRRRVLPSPQPPTAPTVGITQPLQNPGRFSSLRVGDRRSGQLFCSAATRGRLASVLRCASLSGSCLR